MALRRAQDRAHPAFAGLPLILGGNVFGWTAKGEQGFAVLDAFYEAGGRMIDTADVYSVWIPDNLGGDSETLIGQWLASRGVRKDMRIHTKTGMWSGTPGNPGEMGEPALYRPERVSAHLDASLERLQTDHVDLYYAHRDFAELGVDEIADAFDATLASGKVRSLGASNFTAERLKAALDYADSKARTPFTVLQNQYNLVERAPYPKALQELCVTRQIAMVPFFSLAAGYLTGKYREARDYEGTNRGYRAKDYAEKGPAVLAVMDEIAAETGASLTAIALAWLVKQPAIPAPLASARTVEQLQSLLEYTRLELDGAQVERLTSALAPE